MRKISLALLLASASSTPAFAADADQTLPSASPAPVRTAPKVSVFIEGSYIFNNNAHGLPYAQYFGPDNEDEGADTSTHPFKVGSGKGYEISGGFSLGVSQHVTLNAAYTGLRTHRRADTGQFPDYAVVSVLPNGNGYDEGIGTSYNQARVHTDIAADTFDFNVGYDVGLGGETTGTILGGFRYARFHQTTDMKLYDEDGGLETSSHRRSSFTGIGPELGLKLQRPFGHSGFGIAGSVLGAVLFGEQYGRTTGSWADEDDGGEPEAEVEDGLYPRRVNFSHTAETVNAQLGLSYSSTSGLTQGATLTVGYKVDYYAGVRDTANGSSGDGTAHYGKLSDDILSHGPFVSLSYTL